jgi:hemerythrin
MGFKWDQSLATGNNVIDRQHQELFRRMEKLVEATKRDEGKGIVSETIAFLEKYVIQHFDAEEQIQIANSYPEYDSHKHQHQQLLNDVVKLKREFETEGANATMLVKSIASLGNWIQNHVKQSDKALAEYLRDRAKVGTLRETVGLKY